MSLQMCFLRIIKGLEQRTFVESGAGITDIMRMESCDAYLFNKVRTMLVTAAEPAGNSITIFSGALSSTQCRWFDLASLSVLAGIE